MKGSFKIARRRAQSGIALLVAIFVLLLVCVVGIAMIVASGTESSLTGNYHSATTVHYAALAGLEEGRGRLLSKNPNYINNAVPGFLPPPGAPLPVGTVLYIENPLPGETVNPTASGTPATYQDTEYSQEFGVAPATIYQTPSVSTVAGIQGPLYKWVRINAVTAASLNLDVNQTGPPYNNTTPLYFDGTKLNLTTTGYQALEITALAAYPNANGTRKILQYVVAPTGLNLVFPAALTLDGNNVQFSGPNANSFIVDGNDTMSVGSCMPGPTAMNGIGYTGQVDSGGNYLGADSSKSNILSGIPAGKGGNYRGAGTTPPTPNVNYVGDSLPVNLKTVPGLNSLIQTITLNADTILSPSPPLPPGTYTTFTQADLPTSTMSPTNPMTIVVNGNLNLTGWSGTGYGILVVTGELTYYPTATWNGIVLVIGRGFLYSNEEGSGRFSGAVLLAKTVDGAGGPLSTLGSPLFQFTLGAESNGVRYSSCWIKAVQPLLKYDLLSFHEIAQ